MKHSPAFFLSLFLVVVASCAGGPEKQQGLGTGVVIPSVQCASDRSVFYSVYIPKGCREEDRLPVWVAFDPQAEGALPVSKYRSLAEQHRFILMGSNDSRNGLPMDRLSRIAGALVSEAQSRFHADPARLFLMGFSGGARVACMLGLSGLPVRGVIGCGAGLPVSGVLPSKSFEYVVIAGEADPNLAEVILQNGPLTEAGWNHRLMVIPGGHAWPPAEEMQKAICWMNGQPADLHFPPVSYADFYEIDKELASQKELAERFESGDTAWMRKEIGRLASLAKHPKTRNDSLIACRLTAFLGLLSWSRSTSQLNGNQLDQAFRSLTIYRMAEPENPAVDSLFNLYYQKRDR